MASFGDWAQSSAGAATIGGGFGFLGDIAGGLISADSSAKQARKNRQFQERMSSTAYQRGVKDMKAAGLNPMLAFQQGGASTPSGATAQGLDLRGVGSKAVNSAVSAALAKESVLQARAITSHNTQAADNQAAQAANTRANTDIMQKLFPNTARNAQLTGDKLAQDIKESTARMDEIFSRAGLNLQTLQYNKEMQPILLDIQRTVGIMQKLDIPAAEAAAALWDIGGPALAALEKAASLIPGLGPIVDAIKRKRKGREVSVQGRRGGEHYSEDRFERDVYE